LVGSLKSTFLDSRLARGDMAEAGLWLTRLDREGRPVWGLMEVGVVGDAASGAEALIGLVGWNVGNTMGRGARDDMGEAPLSRFSPAGLRSAVADWTASPPAAVPESSSGGVVDWTLTVTGHASPVGAPVAAGVERAERE
jgi:hypothetical protein